MGFEGFSRITFHRSENKDDHCIEVVKIYLDQVSLSWTKLTERIYSRFTCNLIVKNGFWWIFKNPFWDMPKRITPLDRAREELLGPGLSFLDQVLGANISGLYCSYYKSRMVKKQYFWIFMSTFWHIGKRTTPLDRANGVILGPSVSFLDQVLRANVSWNYSNLVLTSPT